MANVEDLSSNKRGAKTGNVFVVDPNPPGMDIIPPEDMFIYVKFSAYPRSRTTYGGNTLEGDPIVFDSGIEGEVNFISTKIKYNFTYMSILHFRDQLFQMVLSQVLML